MLEWLVDISLWLLGLFLFAVLVAAILVGYALRRRNDRVDASVGDCRNDTQEGYIVSVVLTLLGLLIGFTFALAVDRYEARRLLAVESANAIETLYLRVQLLEESHRTRISTITILYAENQILLANKGWKASGCSSATTDCSGHCGPRPFPHSTRSAASISQARSWIRSIRSSRSTLHARLHAGRPFQARCSRSCSSTRSSRRASSVMC